MNILSYEYLIVLMLSVLSSGCFANVNAHDFSYKIYVTNEGKNGILIKSLSYKNKVNLTGKGLVKPAIARLYPNFSVGAITNSIGQFEGFKTSLPNNVYIKWQIAKLSDCDSVKYSKRSPGHVKKLGCTWSPIKGEVFQKHINMTNIRDSKAYKQTGTPANKGSYLYGTRTLDIDLIFNEEHLTVRARSSQTMGLGQ